MRKPDACRGCPLYQDGDGFVPDEVVPGASVYIQGQNPGAAEVHAARPYVGKTGQVMEQEYFLAAQLRRGENVSIGNTLRCRWRGTDDMPREDVLQQAVTHCTQAHRQVPTGTRLIVAQGAHAWRALGNQTAITDWRGYLSPLALREESKAIPCLGVLHVADLFRNPIMCLPSLVDWAKIPRILSGDWPKSVPQRYVWDSCTATVLDKRFAALARHPWVALDTEYSPNRHVWLTGLSGLGGTDGLQWFTNADGVTIWQRHLKQLVQTTPIVFQNAVADMRSLKVTFGIEYTDYRAYEDLMLAHALLWSELPHTLEFIASLYSPYNKMKHLASTNPALYNWGDVIDTAAAWEKISEELT